MLIGPAQVEAAILLAACASAAMHAIAQSAPAPQPAAQPRLDSTGPQPSQCADLG
jgi:hypothetical protein